MNIAGKENLLGEWWINGRKQLAQDYLPLNLMVFGFGLSGESCGGPNKSRDIGEN